MRTTILRPLSAVLLIIFLSQDLAYAAGAAIHIPFHLGVVRSTSEGGPETIIQIEDAHDSLEAQEKIAEILDLLSKKYDVRHVALEGSSGEIDPSLFKSYPDAAASERGARQLVKEGFLNAGELFAATTKEPVAVYGAEEKTLYRENLKVFKDLLKIQEKRKSEIEGFEKTIRTLTERVYNDELKNIFVGLGEDSFTRKWERLEAIAVKKNIHSEDLFHLKRLADCIRLEKSISFKTANSEREALLASLKERLSKDQAAFLLSQSLAYKKGSLSDAEYHKILLKTAASEKIALETYPALQKYSEYAARFESIDLPAVLAEMEIYEERVRRACLVSEDEKTFFEMEKTGICLARFLSASATKKEAEVCEKDLKGPEVVRLAKDLESLSAKYKVPLYGGWSSAAISEVLPYASRFYDLAEKRNQALIQNTLKKMRKDNRRVAALVTGGFHSESISQILKNEKLSQFVILPKIEDASKKRPYLTILSNKNDKLGLGTAMDTARANPFAKSGDLFKPFLEDLRSKGEEGQKTASRWVSNFEKTSKSHRMVRELRAALSGARLAADTPDPYEMAKGQIRSAAKIIDLDPRLFEILTKTHRELHVKFKVRLDTGGEEEFLGFRIMHNNARGPGKGGIRYTRDGEGREEKALSLTRALSTWMSLKTAVVGIPYGGAKGEVVSAKGREYSAAEIGRITRGYVRAMFENNPNAFGPYIDIPAPDIGTSRSDVNVMAVFLDEYLRIQVENGWLTLEDTKPEPDSTKTPYVDGYLRLLHEDGERSSEELAVITGKPVDKNGSLGREKATGQGIFFTTVAALQEIPQGTLEKLGLSREIKGKSVSIQGYGNVGSNTARAFYRGGAKVTAISDRWGTLENPSGINIAEFDRHLKYGGDPSDFTTDGTTHTPSAQRIFESESDLFVPAALEAQIRGENAELVAWRKKIIIEGANGPTTPEADEILEKAGRPVVPDILANSGGVIVSYFEWLQNLKRERWPEIDVDQMLNERLSSATREVFATAASYKVSLRKAANILAIIKIADAELARDRKLAASFSKTKPPYKGFKYLKAPETIEQLKNLIEKGLFKDWVRLSDARLKGDIEKIVDEMLNLKRAGKRDIRYVFLAGPPTVGKSFVAQAVVKSLTTRGYRAVYLDDDKESEKLAYHQPNFDKTDFIVSEGNNIFSDTNRSVAPEENRYGIFVNSVPSFKLTGNVPFTTADMRLIAEILYRHKISEGQLQAIDIIRAWPAERKRHIEQIYPTRKYADRSLNTYLGYELPVVKDQLFRELDYAEKIISMNSDQKIRKESLRIIQELFDLFKDIPAVDPKMVLTKDSLPTQYLSLGARLSQTILPGDREPRAIVGPQPLWLWMGSSTRIFLIPFDNKLTFIPDAETPALPKEPITIEAGKEVVIGRSGSADLRIQRDNQTSRLHAKVRLVSISDKGFSVLVTNLSDKGALTIGQEGFEETRIDPTERVQIGDWVELREGTMLLNVLIRPKKINVERIENGVVFYRGSDGREGQMPRKELERRLHSGEAKFLPAGARLAGEGGIYPEATRIAISKRLGRARKMTSSQKNEIAKLLQERTGALEKISETDADLKRISAEIDDLEARRQNLRKETDKYAPGETSYEESDTEFIKRHKNVMRLNLLNSNRAEAVRNFSQAAWQKKILEKRKLAVEQELDDLTRSQWRGWSGARAYEIEHSILGARLASEEIPPGGHQFFSAERNVHLVLSRKSVFNIYERAGFLEIRPIELTSVLFEQANGLAEMPGQAIEIGSEAGVSDLQRLVVLGDKDVDKAHAEITLVDTGEKQFRITNMSGQRSLRVMTFGDQTVWHAQEGQGSKTAPIDRHPSLYETMAQSAVLAPSQTTVLQTITPARPYSDMRSAIAGLEDLAAAANHLRYLQERELQERTNKILSLSASLTQTGDSYSSYEKEIYRQNIDSLLKDLERERVRRSKLDRFLSLHEARVIKAVVWGVSGDLGEAARELSRESSMPLNPRTVRVFLSHEMSDFIKKGGLEEILGRYSEIDPNKPVVMGPAHFEFGRGLSKDTIRQIFGELQLDTVRKHHLLQMSLMPEMGDKIILEGQGPFPVVAVKSGEIWYRQNEEEQKISIAAFIADIQKGVSGYEGYFSGARLALSESDKMKARIEFALQNLTHPPANVEWGEIWAALNNGMILDQPKQPGWDAHNLVVETLRRSLIGRRELKELKILFKSSMDEHYRLSVDFYTQRLKARFQKIKSTLPSKEEIGRRLQIKKDVPVLGRQLREALSESYTILSSFSHYQLPTDGTFYKEVQALIEIILQNRARVEKAAEISLRMKYQDELVELYRWISRGTGYDKKDFISHLVRLSMAALHGEKIVQFAENDFIGTGDQQKNINRVLSDLATFKKTFARELPLVDLKNYELLKVLSENADAMFDPKTPTDTKGARLAEVTLEDVAEKLIALAQKSSLVDEQVAAVLAAEARGIAVTINRKDARKVVYLIKEKEKSPDFGKSPFKEFWFALNQKAEGYLVSSKKILDEHDIANHLANLQIDKKIPRAIRQAEADGILWAVHPEDAPLVARSLDDEFITDPDLENVMEWMQKYLGARLAENEDALKALAEVLNSGYLNNSQLAPLALGEYSSLIDLRIFNDVIRIAETFDSPHKKDQEMRIHQSLVMINPLIAHMGLSLVFDPMDREEPFSIMRLSPDTDTPQGARLAGLVDKHLKEAHHYIFTMAQAAFPELSTDEQIIMSGMRGRTAKSTVDLLYKIKDAQTEVSAEKIEEILGEMRRVKGLFHPSARIPEDDQLDMSLAERFLDLAITEVEAALKEFSGARLAEEDLNIKAKEELQAWAEAKGAEAGLLLNAIADENFSFERITRAEKDAIWEDMLEILPRIAPKSIEGELAASRNPERVMRKLKLHLFHPSFGDALSDLSVESPKAPRAAIWTLEMILNDPFFFETLDDRDQKIAGKMTIEDFVLVPDQKTLKESLGDRYEAFKSRFSEARVLESGEESSPDSVYSRLGGRFERAHVLFIGRSEGARLSQVSDQDQSLKRLVLEGPYALNLDKIAVRILALGDKASELSIKGLKRLGNVFIFSPIAPVDFEKHLKRFYDALKQVAQSA